MSWEMVKLGDACSSIYDGDHNVPPKAESGVPFVTISNFDEADGTIDFADTKYVPEKYYDSLGAERRPQKDDILYSVVGSFGIPSLVRDNKQFVFQRHIAILRPSCRIVPEFLYYLMKSPDFYHWADSVAVGAAQRTVTLGQLRSKMVPLPPLDIQRRIADVLSAYDKLIENNRKQIKLLEEAAQRLYKEWFVDLRFPGYKTTPVIDGLPEGWRKAPLPDVATFVRGRSYSSGDICRNSGIKLINLNNIAAYGGWSAGAERPYSGPYKLRQVVKHGDIIMAVTDMTKERRLVGHVARVPNNASGSVISMDLIKLIPHGVDINYLFALLRFSGIAELIATLGNGTNVIHLKPDVLSRVGLLVPSDSVQQQYSNQVRSLFAMIEAGEESSAAAREARDRLLPKLMSGEIEV